MTRKTMVKREYIDRQPRIGDRIEIVYENLFIGFPVGTELIIKSIESSSGSAVYAYNFRTGNVEWVSDDWYRIYSDVEYEKVGVDVVEKRLFGFKYKQDTVEKWREVLSNE